MKINEKKKCVEIFDAHYYKVDDEYYPSVTSVLQAINKGDFYHDWLKSVGHNADIIVKKAQESGSKIHQTIEKQFFEGLEITPYGFDEKEWVKMCNFVNWFNTLNEEVGIEIEVIEFEVYYKGWKVAGTIDLICIIGGVRYLLDWKSGNNIYSTSHMQIGAYSFMWNELFPDRKVEKGAIVHIGASIRTKKGFNNIGVKFEEVDIDKNVSLFKNTLALYDEFFRKPAPLLIYPMSLKMKGKENNENELY